MVSQHVVRALEKLRVERQMQRDIVDEYFFFSRCMRTGDKEIEALFQQMKSGADGKKEDKPPAPGGFPVGGVSISTDWESSKEVGDGSHNPQAEDGN